MTRGRPRATLDALRARHDAAWRDPAQVGEPVGEARRGRPAAAAHARARRVLGGARRGRHHAPRHARVRAPGASRCAPAGTARGRRTCRCRTRPGSRSTASAASCTSPARATRTRSSTCGRSRALARRRRRARATAGGARSSRCARASSRAPLPARPGARRRRAARQRRRPERGRPPRRRRRLRARLVAAVHRDARRGPTFARNHLQLNSIAAGPDLATLVLLGLGATRLSRAGPGTATSPSTAAA